MLITITGATGFIGRHLIKYLAHRGDSIYVLSRNPQKARQIPGVSRALHWESASSTVPVEAVDGVDAVVHLAGEPIAGYFSAAHKKKVFESRVLGTKSLVEALGSAPSKPRVLLSGSATGYYGDRGNEELTEDSSPGSGFLAEVCIAWEEAAAEAETLGITVRRIRTGMVLGKDGGALKPLLLSFRLGLGGPFGTGKQWWPWIHVDDYCRLLLYLLEERDSTFPKVFNGTAPHPVTNREFTRALAQSLNRPAFLRVPQAALRVGMGEAADALLLQSTRALPSSALKLDFPFQWTRIEAALNDLLR